MDGGVPNDQPNLNWSKLLSEQRSKEDSSKKEDDCRTPFEKGWDRIVFSTAFRRLAEKTQVHPFCQNDHVHDRLSHSIEVASVGRSLATKIISTNGIFPIPGDNQQKNFIDIACAACLCHDIGNTPFGHAGEDAIRRWTKTNDKKVRKYADVDKDQVVKDLQSFDGNANGFRIISRQDPPRIDYLKLSYATIAATVKYPWNSSEEKCSKFGYFSVDKDQFDEIQRALELRPHERHPISHIVEAADDICNTFMDIEDALSLRIDSAKNFRDQVLEYVRDKDVQGNYPLARSMAIGKAIESAANQFTSIYRDSKSVTSLLTAKNDAEFSTIKSLSKEIYAYPSTVQTEIGCYHIISDILDHLLEAIFEYRENSGTCNNLSLKIIDQTFGKDYVDKQIDKSGTWWLYEVVGFVAGMTDRYAVRFAKMLRGI